MTCKAVFLCGALGALLSACGGGSDDLVPMATYACDVPDAHMCLEAQGPVAALQEWNLDSTQCLSPAWRGTVVSACERAPLSGTCSQVLSASAGQVLRVEYWYSPYWDAMTRCDQAGETWTPY